MEMTQYQWNLIRMWDSLRTDDKGSNKCGAVRCDKCPLRDSVCEAGHLFNTEKAIEIVTQWAKEHPIVTNEDKFKEDWGCEPKSIGGIYLCPSYFGVEECESPFGQSATNPSCVECEKKFWHSEYKEPKKGQTDVRSN